MGKDAAECIWLTSSIWVVMLADMAKKRDWISMKVEGLLFCRSYGVDGGSAGRLIRIETLFWIRMALIPCQNRVNFLIYSSPNRRIYIGIQAMMIRYETSTRSHEKLL